MAEKTKLQIIDLALEIFKIEENPDDYSQFTRMKRYEDIKVKLLKEREKCTKSRLT